MMRSRLVIPLSVLFLGVLGFLACKSRDAISHGRTPSGAAPESPSATDRNTLDDLTWVATALDEASFRRMRKELADAGVPADITWSLGSYSFRVRPADHQRAQRIVERAVIKHKLRANVSE